jgi:sulfide:quinone oxidoreductase
MMDVMGRLTMSTPRVVIVGGGFGGLETAFLLRMRHEGADISLVSPEDSFLFKPNTIYIPFGAEPTSFFVPLEEPLRRRHISFFNTRVESVDSDRKRVALEDGTNLPYDYLVLATGAAMRPEEIPGLGEHAESIFTPAAMVRLGKRLRELHDRATAGERAKVLFLVPPNNKCSGPLYEMVFMLDTWLKREKIRDRVEIAYSTFEKTFIQAFGPRLHEVVTQEFTERGIDGHTSEVVERIEDRAVRYQGGAARPFDLLVSFPPYVAAFQYQGLPSDDRGFLRTELQTRQVVGHPEIYAPGDGGDFPVKQAFLAFLQADTVAYHVSATLDGRPFREPFDPVSMCVMEMFDKATFAQVPLRLTGDPARPVEVRPDAGADYKVGVSPLWRLGKKLLGVYLPMRFRAGEPFHAGMAWQLMDVGLKGMSGVLAN